MLHSTPLPSQVGSTNNSSTVSLSLPSLAAEQEGEYVCLAVNEYGRERKGVMVSVFSHTTVSLEAGGPTVDSGSSAVLHCRVVTDPRLVESLRVTWSKDEVPMGLEGGRVAWNSSLLSLARAQAGDEGRYTCAAQTQHDSATATAQLTVLHEAPSFTSTPIDARVLEGGDLALACQADGIPRPEVAWSFQGREVESSKGRLRLEGMGSHMEGTYLCTAANVYGEIEKSVNVAVIRGVQRDTDNLVPDVVKNIKETILLPCDFKVDHRVEKETEFLWLRDGDTVEYEEGDKYTLLANKSLLIR